MFERYTEPARRALFFARLAATELGGHSIEPEHLLAGLTRAECGGLAARVLAAANLPAEQVYAELKARSVPGDRLPESVELPFGDALMRILRFVSGEADRSGHSEIRTVDLLVGLLREPGPAAELLTRSGLSPEEARRRAADLPGE